MAVLYLPADDAGAARELTCEKAALAAQPAPVCGTIAAAYGASKERVNGGKIPGDFQRTKRFPERPNGSALFQVTG